MNLPLFIFITLALQLVCLWASSKASKKVKNQDDYFLAGKDVKFFPLMMTFIATQIGGGLVLGAAEEAYQFGWSVLLYPIGSCLGFLFLAAGVGKRLAQFQVSTVAQLFEVIYKSPLLKRFASLLSIISLFMILVAQVIASKKFMLSLGVDQNWIFLLFWALIIFYTVLGGLKAVVSIDIIQASFFIAIFLTGFGFVAYVTEMSFAQTLITGFDSQNFELSSAKYWGWLLMPLLFMGIEQDMAQRCFAARSPRIVTKAAAYAAFFTLFICIIPVFFGVLGKTLGIPMIQGSSVFMTVVQTLTTPEITAFIGCAVLAAVISTAISLLNAVSSNLTQDFEFFAIQKNMRIARTITSLIGLGAVLFSFRFDNIVDLLIQSYELSIYCLFVPVLAALFKASVDKRSALVAMVCGGIGFFFYQVAYLPKEIGVILFSAFGFFSVELFLQRKSARQDLVT